jgi:hypothetical protein
VWKCTTMRQQAFVGCVADRERLDPPKSNAIAVCLARRTGATCLACFCTVHRTRSDCGVLGLIRFRGHLSQGEYDVQADGRHTYATSTSPVHR